MYPIKIYGENSPFWTYVKIGPNKYYIKYIKWKNRYNLYEVFYPNIYEYITDFPSKDNAIELIRSLN